MTSAITEFKTLAAIQEAAADWCARRIGGELPPDEEQAFREWLDSHSSHRREYETVEALWWESGMAGDRARIRELRAELQLRDSSTERQQGGEVRSAGRWTPIAMAASIAAAVVVLGLVVIHDPGPVTPAVATQRGEQRTIELDDGTIVELDADTQMVIDYRPAERRVILEGGQAHFDVHEDPWRPFVVVAGDSRIRALGTEFQVYRRSDTVTVTLFEGRVEVVPAAEQPAAVRTAEPVWKKELSPGEQLTVSIAGPGTPEVANVDLDRATAWRRGMLDFDALTLPQVVTEINRYSDRPVVIADSSLNDIRVSGVFEIGDTATVVLALESGFGIDARPRPASGDIALYPAASP